MTEPTDNTETLPGGDGARGRPSEGARPPRVLGDRYRLDELIARGGMASVWRAHDAVLARTVAVKLLHDHLAVDDDFRERFRREAISAAKLSHPNVVGVYDTGAEDNHVYLVMEFVAGTTLKEVIADLGQLDPTRAATLGQQVALALDFAHNRGLVHRDIKPANILVSEDGTAKVADFGIAKLEEASDDLTRTGMVLGTAAYVAPEQILGEPIDGKADQYALGCVMYEALTGRQPFKGESAVGTAALRLERDPDPISTHAPEVPRSLAGVVNRALARHPTERFPTSGAMAEALGRFADPEQDHTVPLLAADKPPVVPVSEDWDESPAPRRRKSPLTPVLVVLALAAALVIAGALAGVVGSGDGDGDGPEEPVDVVDGTPLQPQEVVLFDPGGTGSESGADLPNLFDGDRGTGWQSVGYNTPAFGNLKPGLGFYVDLGSPHQLARVELVTDTPGIAVELRAAEEPATSIDGWTVVQEARDAPEVIDFTLDAQVTTRYLLVWVTGDLQPDGARHRVRFAEMIVEGEPA